MLVVGGGLEGSLLAWTLHQHGHKTVLLDRGRPRDPEAPYDLWLCSPFLYSPNHWRWIEESWAVWENWCTPGERSGLAVAARESTSWLKLTESLEQLRLSPLQVDLRERFPEFQADSSLGHYYFPRLRWLPHSGLVQRLWSELQREGVDPSADTPVTLIDWEHELPTAVAGGTIFRARRMVVAAGRQTPSLLGQAIPELSHTRTWLEGAPLLERPPLEARPHLWVHYARAPLYVAPEMPRWGFGRLLSGTEEREELDFLRNAQRRWFRCEFAEPAVYQLRIDGPADGLPLVDFHPWRQDCVWLTGMAQPNWPWLPKLAEILADPEPVIPPELRTRMPDREAAGATG